MFALPNQAQSCQIYRALSNPTQKRKFISECDRNKKSKDWSWANNYQEKTEVLETATSTAVENYCTGCPCSSCGLVALFVFVWFSNIMHDAGRRSCR